MISLVDLQVEELTHFRVMMLAVAVSSTRYTVRERLEQAKMGLSVMLIL